MKKLLTSLVISWLLIFALSFSASADVLYIIQGKDSASLGLINKDSSGSITNTIISSDFAVYTYVFSFKHKGQNRILIAENQDSNGTNKISIYDPAELSKVLASGNISTNLNIVQNVAEFGDNLILAGDGIYDGKGSIVEINPETCAVVNQFDFGDISTNDNYTKGEIANFARAEVHNGKIYAGFEQAQYEGTKLAWKQFLVEADSVSSLSAAFKENENFPTRYAMRSLNDNLYISGFDGNKGLFKVNSLSSLEKIIDDESWDFDTDGSSGFYYLKPYNGYIRYLYHWDGTSSKEIYDVGEFPDLTENYKELGLREKGLLITDGVKYDSKLNSVFSLKKSYSQSVWTGTNLIALAPSNGNVLQEISGWVSSFAVVESASLNKDDDDDGDSDTTTGSSSGGGCNAGVSSIMLGLLAVAFFKKH